MSRWLFVVCALCVVGFLGCAAASASSASNRLAEQNSFGFSNALGAVTSVDSSRVVVSFDVTVYGGRGSLRCRVDGSSPSVGGVLVGETVVIDCEHGTLRSITPVKVSSHSRHRVLPGFATTLATPEFGSVASKAQCVEAWNTASSAAERSLVAEYAPLAADPIAVPSSQTPQGPDGTTCEILFALPGSRTIVAEGSWRDRTVADWEGFLDYSGLGSFLASYQTPDGVKSDGTVSQP